MSDGGPAFPVLDGRSWGVAPSKGMSLRDWFAGQALSSLFTLEHVQSWERDEFSAAAEYAYQVADAMLKARGSEG